MTASLQHRQKGVKGKTERRVGATAKPLVQLSVVFLGEEPSTERESGSAGESPAHPPNLHSLSVLRRSIGYRQVKCARLISEGRDHRIFQPPQTFGGEMLCTYLLTAFHILCRTAFPGTSLHPPPTADPSRHRPEAAPLSPDDTSPPAESAAPPATPPAEADECPAPAPPFATTTSDTLRPAAAHRAAHRWILLRG